MMRKRYRLCALQMSVAGDNCLGIFFCFFENCGKQFFQSVGNFSRFITQIKTYINGNLIIAASCGMKAFSDIAYPLDRKSVV